MNKRLKFLLQSLRELYSLNVIEKVALRTKFVSRKSKLTPKIFLSLVLFGGEDLCRSSLVLLRSRLDLNEDISISPQALDQRFNENAVQFLQTIFLEMLKKQNEILSDDETLLKCHFKSIKVADSTTITLPKNLKATYKGTGGGGSPAAAKVQLQLDLLTGRFTECGITKAACNDTEYLSILEKTIKKKDLILQDLGYYQADHLRFLQNSEAYYITKIRRTTNLYIPNEKPKLDSSGNPLKGSLYKKVDIQEIVAPLQPGETIEISDIYIDRNKFKTKLILTKLTPECKETREKKFALDLRKRNKVPSESNDFWNTINAYITNIPTSILTKDQIHDIYSLRWQVELMFKIWKSIFKIADVKKVKLERFQCFLYGRLITLLLTSSIVSTSKKILYEEKRKEISPMKAFSIVKESFGKLREKLFQHEITLFQFLKKIIESIIKYGMMSKKKYKKASFEIISSLKFSDKELENLII